MITRNRAGRPLTCTTCNRTFARAEHLQRHTRTHTKEKPFECLCGVAFSRQDLLTRHERISHGGTARVSDERGAHLRLSTPRASPNRRQGIDAGASVEQQQPPTVSFQPQANQASRRFPNHVSDNHSTIQPWDLGGNAVEFPDTYGDVALEFSRFLNTAGLDFDLDLFPYSGQDFLSVPPQSPSECEYAGLVPDGTVGEDDFHELKPLHVTWRINEQQRASYLDQLSTFSGVLPRTFVLPSRLSMARYVAGFVDGLSHHFPFIHMPTFSITAIPDAPELVLALMAVGAQYRYERRSATALYHAARAIITERIRRRELPDPHAAAFHHERLPRTPPNLLATTRAILLLAKFAAWQASPALIRESLSYRALLAHSVRRAGLSESDDDDDNEGQMQDDNAWLHWARAETDRRTKLCVFCFLNLQELAFGLEQPVLLANEIGDIRLPSSCREWLAEGQADWLQARMAGPAPVGFRHALACVLVGPRRDSREEGAAAAAPGGLDDDVPVTSPFGNFILVHALLQRITLARQLALPSTTTSPSPLLRPADVDELDAAFNRWRQEWQRAPESVLDVRRSKDSLAFASTALFGLAHVRLVFSLQASPAAASVYARFQACDAQGAAEAALAAAPPPRRGGPHVLKALLHAVHALNIPVQVGVDYLARCQAFFWSVQHVFCSFECAVFLSRWLFVLAAEEEEERDARPLSEMEKEISSWISRVVQEAGDSLDEEAALGFDKCATQGERFRVLGVAIARLWARQFRNSNTAWPIMKLVGEALERYAALLIS